jgi:hypothetical protein
MDFFETSLPSTLNTFEYEYLSIFFKDYSYMCQNDNLPNHKVWFCEAWQSLKNQLLIDNYLCLDCMSVCFKKDQSGVEIIDYFRGAKEQETEIPEEMKS